MLGGCVCGGCGVGVSEVEVGWVCLWWMCLWWRSGGQAWSDRPFSPRLPLLKAAAAKVWCRVASKQKAPADRGDHHSYRLAMQAS